MDLALNEPRVRFVLLGGFLGSGKTTLMCRLGTDLAARGERVAVITNDQATDLVDTAQARALGLPVEEIAGGCFCCRFADLAKACDSILAEVRPTVLIAEPVGSCADLSATVLAPLRRFYRDRLEPLPYTVLVDPVRLRQLAQPALAESPLGYLFWKQLEEADVLALNKVDGLAPASVAELLASLAARLPATPAVALSAREGAGVAAWWDRLSGGGLAGQHILTIDYDRYADAEAELGWFNATARLAASEPFDGAHLLRELLLDLRLAAMQATAQIGHIKALLESPAGSVRANLTGTGSPVECDGELRCTSATLTLNARVTLAPEELELAAVRALRRTANQAGAALTVARVQSFRPGRPQPTWRFTEGAL